MNKQFDIDDLFRENFGQYKEEPPPRIWKNIKHSMRRNKRRSPGWKFWSLMLIVILPAFIIVGVSVTNCASRGITEKSVLKLQFSMNNNQIRKGSTNFNTVHDKKIKTKKILSVNSIEKTTEVQSGDDNNTLQNEVAADTQETNIDAISEDKTNIMELPLVEENSVIPMIINEEGNDLNGTQLIAVDEIKLITDSLGKPVAEVKHTMTDEITPLQLHNNLNGGSCSLWQLFLNITPEYFIQNNNSTPDRWTYSYELFGEYNCKGWVIEGGLGLGFSKIKTDHELRYKVNELTATYQDVVRIFWDSISNAPAFITETVNLYDSVQKSENVQAEQKSTLLHIQLMAGYKKQFGRFSVTPKAGFRYSMRIADRINIPEPSMNGIVSYRDNETGSAPNKNGYVLLLDCGLSYDINRLLGFTIEPSLRYYLKNIYGTNADAGIKPCSLGLRAGVFVKIE
ncbi:MAG: hypothetical protein WCM76_06505 [Bacteroidota bacterium]